METFSASLAICAGNPSFIGEFPAQRPVVRSFDVFVDLRRTKQLSTQWWGWWFEPPLRPLCRHCNVELVFAVSLMLRGILIITFRKYKLYVVKLKILACYYLTCLLKQNETIWLKKCISKYRLQNGVSASGAGAGVLRNSAYILKF